MRQANEVGKLSVITESDKKGKIKTVEPETSNQSAFLVFDSRKGMLKNFMSNFLTQFNDPKRFGIYKLLVNNFEANMTALKEMLQNRENKKIDMTAGNDSFAIMDEFIFQNENASLNVMCKQFC